MCLLDSLHLCTPIRLLELCRETSHGVCPSPRHRSGSTVLGTGDSSTVGKTVDPFSRVVYTEVPKPSSVWGRERKESPYGGEVSEGTGFFRGSPGEETLGVRGLDVWRGKRFG